MDQKTIDAIITIDKIAKEAGLTVSVEIGSPRPMPL